MRPPLFDRYLFADYSGAGEHDSPQKSIVVYKAQGRDRPERVPAPGERAFSRAGLREYLLGELDRATRAGGRVIFGFDHQFSWPARLWEMAGLSGADWREAVVRLAAGGGGRPPLDIPRRFCRKFNEFVGEEVFWTPMAARARDYGLGRQRAWRAGPGEEFRLSEQHLLAAGFRPQPADAVGGQGPGVVGGQTICGLYHLARLLDLETVRWWPFDGLEINDKEYEGKHLGVEVYPAMFLPKDEKKDDDSDARFTCQAIQNADEGGRLGEWMNLSGLSAPDQARVLKEGWVLGVLPGSPGHKDGP